MAWQTGRGNVLTATGAASAQTDEFLWLPENQATQMIRTG